MQFIGKAIYLFFLSSCSIKRKYSCEQTEFFCISVSFYMDNYNCMRHWTGAVERNWGCWSLLMFGK